MPKSKAPKFRWEVEANGMPSCCGITVLGDAVKLLCVKKRPDRWCPDDGETFYEPRTFKKAISDVANSYMLYTTIPSQKDVIAELEKLHFTQLATFKNKNTRNTVTIWGRPCRIKRT